MKHLHIIKKSLAAEAGLTFYASHKLCPKGHFSERWVTGGGCRDCRLERAERDAEKIRERDIAYRARTKDQQKARNTAYYEKNREIMKAANAQYQKDNREKCRKWCRDFYARNPEKVIAWTNDYRERNPAFASTMRNARRARIRQAEGFHTKEDVLSILEKQKRKCAFCTIKLKTEGKGIYHVDHIISLSRGGSNWPHNLQMLCPGCNSRKHAKHPIDFAQENGKLL